MRPASLEKRCSKVRSGMGMGNGSTGGAFGKRTEPLRVSAVCVFRVPLAAACGATDKAAVTIPSEQLRHEVVSPIIRG